LPVQQVSREPRVSRVSQDCRVYKELKGCRVFKGPRVRQAHPLRCEVQPEAQEKQVHEEFPALWVLGRQNRVRREASVQRAGQVLDPRSLVRLEPQVRQERLGLRGKIQPRGSLTEGIRPAHSQGTPHLISEEWYKRCLSAFNFGEELPHNGDL